MILLNSPAHPFSASLEVVVTTRTPVAYLCFLIFAQFGTLKPARLCGILDNSGLQTLRVLDIDGLHVRVQLLLGALFIVTLTRDADTKAEWDALDSGFPDLLVQLRVKADILSALHCVLVSVGVLNHE